MLKNNILEIKNNHGDKFRNLRFRKRCKYCKRVKGLYTY